MIVHARLLTLAFFLSACLGLGCGSCSCASALGYATEVIPRVLAEQGLNPRVSGTPSQVARVYLVAAMLLAGCAVPQCVAAYALFARRSWARRSVTVASFCAFATCLPVGVYGLYVCARMTRGGDPWASA